jgi:hypothetical protein
VAEKVDLNGCDPASGAEVRVRAQGRASPLSLRNQATADICDRWFLGKLAGKPPEVEAGMATAQSEFSEWKWITQHTLEPDLDKRACGELYCLHDRYLIIPIV